MQRLRSLLPLLLAAFVLPGLFEPALAVISWTGTLDPADPTTWTSSTTGRVGYLSNGSITVDDGSGLLSRDGYIAYSSGYTGQVTVDGSGSMWTNASHIKVGYAGTGSLNVINGGTVSDNASYVGGYVSGPAGATGVATVSGADSLWSHSSDLILAYSGDGTLNVNGGGTVTDRYGYIGGCSGSPAGSTGVATVSGTESLWSHTMDLIVGYSGNGTLNVNGGGTVSDRYGYIGGGVNSPAGSTGMATVSGRNSRWNHTADLFVGYSGNSTLDIQSGGVVSDHSGYIGGSAGSTGVVTVSGDNSLWNHDADLYVAHSGNGTLNLHSGGNVTVAGTTYVAYGSASTGKIDFGPGGGTLTTKSLVAAASQLMGTGTVKCQGLRSDVNLVFDSAASLNQTITLNQPGQNVALNLDVTSGSGELGVGWKETGSLRIDNGIAVGSSSGTLGYQSTAVGMATVTGANSRWSDSTALHVGYHGRGTLDILDGGTVANTVGYIAEKAGSKGTVTVSGIGSSWTNSADAYVGYSGDGTLSITDGATVSNTSGNIGYSNGSKGAVTVSGSGSHWTNSSDTYIGYSGNGSLTIADGGSVVSGQGYIGYKENSTGAVAISGSGSTWSSSQIWVGWLGNATLNIMNGGSVVANTDSHIKGAARVSGHGSTWTSGSAPSVGTLFTSGVLNIVDGGSVSNSRARIAFDLNHNDNNARVRVDGAGSTWTNSSDVTIGYLDDWDQSIYCGTLSITGGGTVSAANVEIRSWSIVAIDIGNGSSLNIGGGSGTIINNGGKLRIITGAGAVAGVPVTPIRSAAWSGAYELIGCTLAGTGNYQFIPSEIRITDSGTLVSLNLATTQRVLVNDPASGWAVGASFLQKSASIDFTATVADVDTVHSLETLLDCNEAVRGAWGLVASGYSSSDLAYLSFEIVPGDSRDELTVWHYDGTTWAEYDAWDLTCNGVYASFMTTGFGAYAVTASLVPGDANGDNLIDATDAAVLASHWGRSGDWSDGDFNRDGLVTAADAAILAANWSPGVGSEQNGSAGSVPEPTAVTLLLGLAIVAIWRRNRAIP